MPTKKPMASPATQKQYNKKMAFRGKMTDEANKARYKEMMNPKSKDRMVDVSKKPKPKGPMATKLRAAAGKPRGLAGLAASAVGYVGSKIVESVKNERKTRKKLESDAKNKKGK